MTDQAVASRMHRMWVWGLLIAVATLPAACGGTMAVDPDGATSTDGAFGPATASGPVADQNRQRLESALAVVSGLEGPTHPHAVYRCRDGRTLSVVFRDDAAEVTTSGQTAAIILPEVPAASGIRFATATHDLHTRGREALWTVGRMMPMTCRALRP